MDIFIVRGGRVLVQQVVPVGFEHELVVFVVFADMDFVSYRQVGLEERLGSGTHSDTVLNDISRHWITVQPDKIAATFGPLTSGIRAVHAKYSEATVDWSPLIKDLRNSKHCLLPEPRQ